MTATLIKTEFPISLQGRRGGNFITGGRAWFVATDPDDARYYREIVIDLDTWEALGSPKTITVTVEPGDKLNE